MTDPRDVERALTFLDSTDRATWIRVGMAVRAGLGDDEGKPIWMAWSATSAKFDARIASRTWDSFRSHSITIGTLFALAKAAGFRFEKRERDPDYQQRRREQVRRQQANQQRDQAQREQRYEAAARTAQAMVERATYGPHPYLEAKGLRARGLVLDGALLVPMRDHQTNRVMAVQVIQPDGAKKYHPAGCRTAGTVHALGKRRGRTTWHCEGYATGLSILAGLEAVYHTDVAVLVCFSAGQLAKVASQKNRGQRQFVCGDHDYWHCKNGHRHTEPRDSCPECGASLSMPAGEKAARDTGLPYWIPDTPGCDANDYMVQHGARALGSELLEIQRLATQRGNVVGCWQSRGR